MELTSRLGVGAVAEISFHRCAFEVKLIPALFAIFFCCIRVASGRALRMPPVSHRANHRRRKLYKCAHGKWLENIHFKCATKMAGKSIIDFQFRIFFCEAWDTFNDRCDGKKDLQLNMEGKLPKYMYEGTSRSIGLN